MQIHHMAQPIHTDFFYHDGRGPELQQIHWSIRGTRLKAIEYLNPNDDGEASIKHVRFDGLQVVMITPEEVVEYRGLTLHLGQSHSAAMFDLGKSEWLRSFSQHHLVTCHHFQLLFYDELFDVICERVTCHKGKFTV